MGVDVSVVVVSYNVRDFTLACLDSLRRHAGARPAETILVDNASADGTADAVRERFPEVRLLANDRNLGFGAANNQGIRLSTGRYLLLLNCDAEVRDGSIQHMAEYLDAHPEVGILGPRLLYGDGSHQLSVNPFPDTWSTLTQFFRLPRLFPESRVFAPHRFALTPRDFPRATEVDWVSGACLLVRREMLEEIGLFDESFFMYYEETDLCRRAWEAGWRVVYDPQTSVVHHGRKSAAKELPACLEHAQRSLVHFVSKHGSAAHRLLARTTVLLNCAAWSLLAWLKTWRRSDPSDARRLASCRAAASSALRGDPGPRVPTLRPIPASLPTVSVVVPTYRRGWEEVSPTLEALAAQDPPPHEVIVIDQTPRPDPRIEAWARSRPAARYVHIDTPGLPNARNVGAAEAVGEVVAFVDDDAVPVPGWAGAHARRYRRGSVDGVVGRVLIPGRPRSRRARCRVGSFRAFDADFVDNYDADFPTECDSLTGCNMSVRRSALTAAGGFRVEYGGTAHLEETDLSLRLLRRGGRIVFEPSAEVEHRVNPSGGCRAPDRARWVYWYARNYALLFATHFRGFGAWPFVAQRVARVLFFCMEARSLLPLGSGLMGLADGLFAHRSIAARTRDLARWTGRRLR